MSNYIAVIFETEKKAGAGLHKLWQMDTDRELTVHGAAIVRRDDLGDVQVSHKHTDAGMRTAVGVGIGAMLGAFAGPVGVAAGIAGAAAISVGAGLGAGAAFLGAPAIVVGGLTIGGVVWGGNWVQNVMTEEGTIQSAFIQEMKDAMSNTIKNTYSFIKDGEKK